jgi:rRNA-processing protein FCF1
MKKAILDTSFILTAVRQKIDFFPELENTGFKILIPDLVLREIEKISNSNSNSSLAGNAKLALKILGKENFKEIKLPEKGSVDDSIVEFAKSNSEFVVATLDKEIKNKIKNSKLVIKQKKRVELA